ncbi:MAG: cysteine hydrolase [Erysipelotrichaceae bacterium]|nr:cysteine hydrolase [Erysipelotrichaceae bacterium]
MNKWKKLVLCALSCMMLGACGTEKETDNTRSGDVLLVIDMQNAYTEDGPWTCVNMDETAEKIKTLIDSGDFAEIIFTTFSAPEKPEGAWVTYNELNQEVNEDAEMNRVIPLLEPYTKEYPVAVKSTYSSLENAQVRRAAEACMKRGDSLVLSGVVSECCVLATAFDAIDLGSHVIYLTDACAGVSEDVENNVAEILKELDYAQTAIMSTEEYLKTHGG